VWSVLVLHVLLGGRHVLVLALIESRVRLVELLHGKSLLDTLIVSDFGATLLSELFKKRRKFLDGPFDIPSVCWVKHCHVRHDTMAFFKIRIGLACQFKILTLAELLSCGVWPDLIVNPEEEHTQGVRVNHVIVSGLTHHANLWRAKLLVINHSSAHGVMGGCLSNLRHSQVTNLHGVLPFMWVLLTGWEITQ